MHQNDGPVDYITTDEDKNDKERETPNEIRTTVSRDFAHEAHALPLCCETIVFCCWSVTLEASVGHSSWLQNNLVF